MGAGGSDLTEYYSHPRATLAMTSSTPNPSALQIQPAPTPPTLIRRDRPSVTPLPGNRPIASNDTEDINELLGYLD